MKRSNLVTLSVWRPAPRSERWETVVDHVRSGWKVVALATTFAFALSVTGCATESLRGEQDLAQRIADADTPAEHEYLAAWYEQEAKGAEEKVGHHQRMQRLYEARRDRPARGRLQMAPYADYDPGTNAEWSAMVEACRSRVLGAEQAKQDYLTLAKMHRQMAATSKL
jgi:hypothetical protein